MYKQPQTTKLELDFVDKEMFTRLWKNFKAFNSACILSFLIYNDWWAAISILQSKLSCFRSYNAAKWFHTENTLDDSSHNRYLPLWAGRIGEYCPLPEPIKSQDL